MSVIESILQDPVILPAGGILLATHILLCVLFKYVLPDGPWKKMPSFTAHQAITLVMMTIQTILGFKYFTEPGLTNLNEDGLFLSRLAMGLMLFWDLPVGFVSYGMGDPIMMVHHICFFVVSAITLGYFSSDGSYIGSAYAPFFFGVVELSSIPLAVVDVFHPKQEAWNGYLSNSRFLTMVNDYSRMAFAVLYVGTRMIYFPYIIFYHCIPDCLALLTERPELAGPSYTLLVLAVFFMILQIYWGMLIIKQATKAMRKSTGKAESKNK